MVKGIYVQVYRPAGRDTDGTNGGPTGKASTVLLVGAGIVQDFAPREDIPTLELVKGQHGPYAIPYKEGDVLQLGLMWGGNFVYTLDSRFPFDHPIPVHDRWESSRQSRIFSE